MIGLAQSLLQNAFMRVEALFNAAFGDRLVAKFGLPVRGFRDARHHAGPGHELFTSRNVLGRGIVTSNEAAGEVAGAGTHDDA